MILALLVDFVLLVVFYKSVASCDACCDNFWEGVFGLPRRLQSLIVVLDGPQRVELRLDGGHGCTFRLTVRYVHYSRLQGIQALASF